MLRLFKKAMRRERYVDPSLLRYIEQAARTLIAAEEDRLAQRMLGWLDEMSFRVERNDVPWSGFYIPGTRCIFLSAKLLRSGDEARITKTIMHELAHRCGIFGREFFLPWYFIAHRMHRRGFVSRRTLNETQDWFYKWPNNAADRAARHVMDVAEGQGRGDAA